MQWIKAHLNAVVAGSVSLLAVVALVLGVLMTNVAEGMNREVSLFPALRNPNGVPKSVLDELRRQQLARHEALAKEVLRTERMTGEHKALDVTKDLFPKENENNQFAVFNFRDAFLAARRSLLVMLKAQDKPTDAEVNDQREKIIQRRGQQEAEAQKAQGTKAGPAGGNKAGPGFGPTSPPPRGGTNFGLGPGMGSGLGGSSGLPPVRPDAPPEERVRDDPQARAAVVKARTPGFLCYASEKSLDPRPAITEGQSERPRTDEMWYAQVSLWVQEDVLGALARLNEEEAAKLPPEERWVGNMPFKHLLSFTFGGYVPAPKDAASGSVGGGGCESWGPAPVDASAVLSKNGCTKTVDVVQFTMQMVIEAKALPEIIDKICESGFYTVLQVGFEAVPPNVELVDYIYGPQPALKVWLLCEGSLLRSHKITWATLPGSTTYDKFMPPSVREEIDAGKPVGGAGAAPTSGFQQMPMGIPRGGAGFPMDPRARGGRPGMPPSMPGMPMRPGR